MNFVTWLLVAVLAGLVAEHAMQRGSYGRGCAIALGLSGSIVVSWIFQSRWASPDPGMVALTIVAAVGAAGLIVAQRKIWPAMAERAGPIPVAWRRPRPVPPCVLALLGSRPCPRGLAVPTLDSFGTTFGLQGV